MRWNHVLFTIVGAVLFVGCTPSPEKICGKAVEVGSADLEKAKKAVGSSLKDDDKSTLKSDCMKETEKLKGEKADDYKKLATCTMEAKDAADLGKCDTGAVYAAFTRPRKNSVAPDSPVLAKDSKNRKVA